MKRGAAGESRTENFDSVESISKRYAERREIGGPARCLQERAGMEERGL